MCVSVSVCVCVCVCTCASVCMYMCVCVCVLVSSSTDLVALITLAEYLQHYPVSVSTSVVLPHIMYQGRMPIFKRTVTSVSYRLP